MTHVHGHGNGACTSNKDLACTRWKQARSTEEPWAEVQNEDVRAARLARRDALARAKKYLGFDETQRFHATALQEKFACPRRSHRILW